jgi:hypothetical protein
VFRDLEGIEPGVDFVDQIEKEIAGCRAVLVVIGPRWSTVSASNGTPRLRELDDPVRIEVAAALNRPELKVIPVLVDGAKMPEPEDLPEALVALPRRAGVEITDARFDFDTNKLIEVLKPALGTVRPPDDDGDPKAVTERRVAMPLADAYRYSIESGHVLENARVERADEVRTTVVLRVGRSLVSWGERVTIQLIANGGTATKARVTSVPVEPPKGVRGIQEITQRVSAPGQSRKRVVELRNRENVERIIRWLETRAGASKLPSHTHARPAGWYADGDPRMLRWWDGSAWTSHQMPRPQGGEGRPPTVAGPVPGSSAGAASAKAVAGWYADPSDPGLLRWWNGGEWTARTAARPR